jgi:hypothetical protein
VSRILPTIGSILAKVRCQCQFTHHCHCSFFLRLPTLCNFNFWSICYLLAQGPARWTGCRFTGPFDDVTQSMSCISRKSYEVKCKTFLLKWLFLMLLCTFQNAPAAVVKAVFDKCFVSTVQIVLESDDHGEMQVHAKTRFICAFGLSICITIVVWYTYV